MCGNYLYYVCMYVCMYVTMILPLHFSVPIYTYIVPGKKKKKKNSHKIKRGAGPLPGPEYILSRTPFYQFHKEHPKNTKF